MAVEEVYKGENISEVLRVLAQYKEDAQLIAGGTDLIIDIRNKKLSPKVLIDISTIEDMRRIEEIDGFIEIGSGVTFTQVMESDLFQGNLHGLSKASRLVGSPQIRNKGTLGGNIANGSPAADSVPPLICLGAILVIESLRGTREVKLEDFYKEGQGLKEDELITKIKFKKPKLNEVLSFSKLGLRKALAISRLTISILLKLDGQRVEAIRVASGALAKYPMRELEVEDFLLGKDLNEEIIRKSVEVIQTSMDERLRGRSTLPYKRVAVERVLIEALEEGVSFYNRVVEA